jgi:lipoprotein-releasing system ATP-binding protein
MSKPTSGSVRISGIGEWSNENLLSKYRNEIIGFVFQSFNLLPEFSALENVMLPALIAGKNRADASKKAMELLNSVSVAPRAHHLPSELSGGEQQRVAMARALINMPKIFIADEPTGNLDKKTGGEVIDLLMKLQSEYNFTLLIATHNEEIAPKCSRIIRIVDGQVI